MGTGRRGWTNEWKGKAGDEFPRGHVILVQGGILPPTIQPYAVEEVKAGMEEGSAPGRSQPRPALLGLSSGSGLERCSLPSVTYIPEGKRKLNKMASSVPVGQTATGETLLRRKLI